MPGWITVGPLKEPLPNPGIFSKEFLDGIDHAYELAEEIEEKAKTYEAQVRGLDNSTPSGG